ncbi:MAG: hypothetical protein M3072_12795 [Candidatus Dormibacteraeota bacterium]|nr:hypothetical protein [Candidatus Dormibacteraeota bacterium]
MPARAKPSATIGGRSAEVGSAFAIVDRHAHAKPRASRPRLLGQLPLDGSATLHRWPDAVEYGKVAVALSVAGQNAASEAFDLLSDEAIMQLKSDAHALWALLPVPRRPLDVSQKENYTARGRR